MPVLVNKLIHTIIIVPVCQLVKLTRLSHGLVEKFDQQTIHFGMRQFIDSVVQTGFKSFIPVEFQLISVRPHLSTKVLTLLPDQGTHILFS